MTFKQFKTLAEVLKQYRIRFLRADFPTPTIYPAPETLRDDIRFTLQHIPYDVSEAAICENLIYPILKAAWRDYADTLSLWSHQPIQANETLAGVPDYLIAKRSELGVIVMETPYVAVVGAKRDDFSGGWAQCGLELYAIQTINASPQLPLYGIVSNGEIWEFAQLEADRFTLYNQRCDINELDQLFGTLRMILERCKSAVTAAQP
ncbi:MAG: hypothetical protein V9H25_19480 [Candidatus Competibacter sp.]